MEQTLISEMQSSIPRYLAVATDVIEDNIQACLASETSKLSSSIDKVFHTEPNNTGEDINKQWAVDLR